MIPNRSSDAGPYDAPRIHFASEEEAAEYDYQRACDHAERSSCCDAPLRVEMRTWATDPETGYREGGPVEVCTRCGAVEEDNEESDIEEARR
jgi:hypothetical protein